MEDERDAEDAIRALDRIEFGRKGRRLRVEWTKHERGGDRRSGGPRRSSNNMRPSKTLFVINFDPYHTRTRDLERHFEPYGKILNVRIRRNFAFVQFKSQEDATRALDATNMSKLMDRVISVEYAVKDDDDSGVGGSPERGRNRSPEKRRRSPSPYRRERGSPDYGRGSSPGPYKRNRNSPDYGRRSPAPYRRDRGSPDYGRGHSVSPSRRDRDGGAIGRRERSPENGHDRSRSPYSREVRSPDNGGHARDRSPAYERGERRSRENGRSPSRSPYGRERQGVGNGEGQSPEGGGSPGYNGAESPAREQYSRSSAEA